MRLSPRGQIHWRNGRIDAEDLLSVPGLTVDFLPLLLVMVVGFKIWWPRFVGLGIRAHQRVGSDPKGFHDRAVNSVAASRSMNGTIPPPVIAYFMEPATEAWAEFMKLPELQYSDDVGGPIDPIELIRNSGKIGLAPLFRFQVGLQPAEKLFFIDYVQRSGL